MSNTPPRHPDDGTLAYYNANSDAFWAGTRDHDVRQNIESLLSHIERPAPLTILDLGCGPGRDLRTLSEMGHVAVGLDGAETFVAMARAYRSYSSAFGIQPGNSTLSPSPSSAHWRNASSSAYPPRNSSASDW